MIPYKTTRMIAGTMHIAVAIFQLCFIYTPLHDVPNILTVVQWVSTPLLFITGAWIIIARRMHHKQLQHKA